MNFKGEVSIKKSKLQRGWISLKDKAKRKRNKVSFVITIVDVRKRIDEEAGTFDFIQKEFGYLFPVLQIGADSSLFLDGRDGHGGVLFHLP